MDKVLEVKTRCCDSLETRVYCIHPHDLSSEESIPEPPKFHLFDQQLIRVSLEKMEVELPEGTVVLPTHTEELLNYWSELRNHRSVIILQWSVVCL